MAVSGVSGNLATYAAQTAQPKGVNPALSYNRKQDIAEQNQQTGSQLNFEKERSAIGAQLVVNLVI